MIYLNDYKKIHNYIDTNFNTHIEDIQRFLRQPGISLTGEGMKESNDMLLKYITNLGAINTALVDFEEGWPFIYGELNSKQPNAKTLLIYGQWDVLAVDPDKWLFPPFAAEILNGTEIGLGAEIGDVLVARGACDQRGPLLAFLKAV